MAFLEKIFGSYSKKELARIEPIKQKVLDLESKYADMPTKELQAQTAVLKGRLKMVKLWTIFCRMLLQSAGRQHGAPSGKSRILYRLSAALSCIRAVSPR